MGKKLLLENSTLYVTVIYLSLPAPDTPNTRRPTGRANAKGTSAGLSLGCCCSPLDSPCPLGVCTDRLSSAVMRLAYVARACSPTSDSSRVRAPV
jgi:hypothetical protein